MTSRVQNKIETDGSGRPSPDTEQPIQYICACCAGVTVNKPAVCSLLIIFNIEPRMESGAQVADIASCIKCGNDAL